MSDPQYQNEVAWWVRTCISRLIQYDIVPGTASGRLMEIDECCREIRIRSGETFERFNQLAGLASRYIVGGQRWAPEVHMPRPRLHVVPAVPDQILFKPVVPPSDVCPQCQQVAGRN